MKHLLLIAVVSYAVLMGAPRSQADVSALALKAALFFAELSAMLRPPASGYDAGFAEPYYPSQDA